MRGSRTFGSFLPSVILLIHFSLQGTARGARERRIMLLLWSETGSRPFFIVLEGSFYTCIPLGEGLGAVLPIITLSVVKHWVGFSCSYRLLNDAGGPEHPLCPCTMEEIALGQAFI